MKLSFIKSLVLILLASGISLCVAFSENSDVVFQKNVMIPMSDGTKLAANIFLPKAEGSFPTLLMRTPYGKGNEKQGDGNFYASRGYAVVLQDTRGKGDSEGKFEPFRHEGKDGFDTQEWVGKQKWCNGKIGTFGGSYVGFTQWISAPYGSRYVQAMVPVVPMTNPYCDAMYVGGAYQLQLSMVWGSAVGIPSDKYPKLEKDDWVRILNYLPLNTWDTTMGHEVSFLRGWVAHPTYGDYWKERGMDNRFADVTVPILNIGGWYDIFSKATLEQISRVRSESKNLAIRRNQFAIIGPWGHGAGKQKTGELDFGASANLDFRDYQTKWFDFWLKGENTGVNSWPAYYLFVMGKNEWRGESEWPLNRTQYTKYYLHSDGKANTLTGTGKLDTQTPAAEAADSYIYDPSNPVPTLGGNNLFGQIGPYDQQKIEARDDVLVYTSEPLAKELEVTGPVKMALFAASSAPDTDFTAKLVDVYPDGKAINLCDGIIRARFRESNTKTTLIEPDKVYQYDIDLWVTSNVFLPGHRMRVEISSSNFPRFDRNPNSGKPFGTDTEVFKATQKILHDAEHPSHLLLPVIP